MRLFRNMVLLLQEINAIVRLSHLLCCVNSSVNFIIYYLNGTKFRNAWCATYGPIFKYCCSWFCKPEIPSTESEEEPAPGDGAFRMTESRGKYMIYLTDYISVKASFPGIEVYKRLLGFCVVVKSTFLFLWNELLLSEIMWIIDSQLDMILMSQQ